MVAKVKSFEDLDGNSLLDEINKEYHLDEFGIRDLNVSSRVLQHWSEYGVLPDKGRKEDENHKFNFIELIWLKIVVELRLLGIPLRTIKVAKSWLLKETTISEILQIREEENLAERLYPIWGSRAYNKKAFVEAFSQKKVIERMRKRKFTILEIYILMFFASRSNFKAIVFSGGQSFIHSIEANQDDEQLMDLLEKESHIEIPFVKLFKGFLEDERYYDFLSRAKLLNSNELMLLALIREGKAERITIHMKDHKPQIFEVKRHKNVMLDARLSEIILKSGYQELTVKTNGGNVSFSSITTKIHLK